MVFPRSFLFFGPLDSATALVRSELFFRQYRTSDLLLVSVPAGSGRERARDVFDHRARGPIQDGFERGVKLVLQFLGDATGIFSRTGAFEKVSERSRAFVFLPGPFPDHLNELGSVFANFLFGGAFDLLQMSRGNAETERDSDRIGRLRFDHTQILPEKDMLDNGVSLVYTKTTIYTHQQRKECRGPQ